MNTHGDPEFGSPSDLAAVFRWRCRRDPLGRLTRREREVPTLMAEGRSQGIADRFVISLRAVEKYVSSIFSKLDLPTGGTDSERVLAVLLYLRD